MIVVLISANAEWQVVRSCFPAAVAESSPLGDWFVAEVRPAPAGWQPALQAPASTDWKVSGTPVRFFHGGWGKIAAAASTQYVIDRWQPELLINLGTCGGFAGAIERGTMVLAERTLVYDIIEQMGDADEALAHYSVTLDLSWLGEPLPQPVQRALLVSADRDLVAEELPQLRARFGAIAGDWESGAIAYVAARNRTRCLILRGVTDLVGEGGGEAYDGTMNLFRERTREVMTRLLEGLPTWIAQVK
jgi:adenosylhomocysteine nucleosidase